MKLSGFQRLIKEDVAEEYQPLMDNIGRSLNKFAEEVLNALNKNISIDDNLNMQAKDIDLIVDSSGNPTVTTSFKSILNTKVKGIIVSKAENLTNPNTYPTGCPFVSFTENNSVITIKNVTGLQANQKYRLRLETRG